MNQERYIQLLLEFPPRPIRSEEQLEATQAVVDKLIDKNPDETEREYMSVLGTLIKEYEDANVDLT